MSLPTPYYQDDAVTLYHGDCRDILPTLGRFDMLLTDPPYGIGRDGSTRTTSRHGGRKAYEFRGWDAERPEAATFSMLLGATDLQIIWGGNYFADLLPPSQRWLVWDKGQRIAQSDGELAWTSMEGALRIFTLNRVALMQDGAQHPTQKPLALMSWCLGLASGVTSVVDPFCGVGTTLRAAKDRNIRAVGIEREESYCAIAKQRLSQNVLDFGGVA